VLGFTLQEIQQFVSIREDILDRRQVYNQAVDLEQKRQQLVAVGRNVDQQLEMIDQKIQKLTEFRDEIQAIRRRVNDAMEKLTTREGE